MRGVLSSGTICAQFDSTTEKLNAVLEVAVSLKYTLGYKVTNCLLWT